MSIAAVAQQNPSEREALAKQFSRDGFVIARGLFSSEEIAEIRETFMTQAANGPVEGLSDGHYKSLTPDDPLSWYPRMMHPHKHAELPVGPLSMRYMLDKRLHDLLAAFMEEEPVAAQSMFYFKPPGARGQELHQDNFYLRVAPDTCYAAWVAVDDADEENGGMMVVPGSNDIDISCPEQADPTRSFTTHFVPVPKGMEATPLTLKAGDVLFFNGSVIHGSYPNTSRERFRRAFICHYVPEKSAELSSGYSSLHFDGTPVTIPAAVGGGPCGITQPMAPH
jgi:phytanoyl-CoA hydroxylase